MLLVVGGGEGLGEWGSLLLCRAAAAGSALKRAQQADRCRDCRLSGTQGPKQNTPDVFCAMATRGAAAPRPVSAPFEAHLQLAPHVRRRRKIAHLQQRIIIKIAPLRSFRANVCFVRPRRGERMARTSPTE